MEDHFFNKLEKIKAFVFDVDGVFTSGELLLLNDGSMIRTLNIKDGFAVKHALQHHYHLSVISGSGSDGVFKRLRKLGVNHIYFYEENKTEAFHQFLHQHAIEAQKVLFMGDDVPDAPVMKQAGIAACPNDAVQEIVDLADYQCKKGGGNGCVREVIEMILKVQGNWVRI